MVLVSLIWGGVIYRFFNFVGHDTSNIETKSNVHAQELPKFEKDSFSLHKNYRDPFLNTIVGVANTEIRHVQIAKPRVEKYENNTQNTSPQIPFPFVQHLGIINNGDKGNNTHIIIIDENKYLISKPGKYAKVEVIELTKDFIKLKFNNEIKTFRP